MQRFRIVAQALVRLGQTEHDIALAETLAFRYDTAEVVDGSLPLSGKIIMISALVDESDGRHPIGRQLLQQFRADTDVMSCRVGHLPLVEE